MYKRQDISYAHEVISVRTSWRLGRRLFQANVSGKPVSVQIIPMNEGNILKYAGTEVRVRVRTPRIAELAAYMPAEADDSRRDQLRAPIAGLIVDIRVNEGDPVTVGQELAVLEAMKMENVIYADHDAVVKKIHIAPQDSVQADQLLLEFSELKDE